MYIYDERMVRFHILCEDPAVVVEQEHVHNAVPYNSSW